MDALVHRGVKKEASKEEPAQALWLAMPKIRADARNNAMVGFRL